MDHPGPPKPPNPEQMEKMVNELAKELSLSTEQKEAILKIQLDQMKAMKEKMDKQGPPDRATMEAARKELDQKTMVLLSAEQKTKYTKFMESHKPPRRGGPVGPGGPPQH